MMGKRKVTVEEVYTEILEKKESEERLENSEEISEAEEEELSAKDLFSQIYHEMYYEIYYFAKRMLRNEDNLDDVLQDIFFEVYKNIEKLREHENYRGWIYTTTKNKAKKANHLWMVQIEKEENPLEFYTDMEYQKAIDENLMLLDYQIDISKEEYELLEKHFLEGYTASEIAKEKEIKEGACKMRISRALQKIRSSMTPG